MKTLAGKVTLRPAQCAEATGLSLSTIKRALRSGVLPSKRHGHARLVKVEDLKAFVDSLEDA